MVNTTLYVVLRGVSRSGMTRYLDIYTIQDGEPRRWTYTIAVALGWRYDEKRENLVAIGAGMDMGFHTIHTLGHVLFPGGYVCRGTLCRSTEHSPKLIRERCAKEGYVHRDSGYALQTRWL